MSAGAFSRRPVWLGRIWARTFASLTQDPIGIEGHGHTGRTHVVSSGHGTSLSFCTGRLSFRWQFLGICFLLVGDELVLLHLYDTGPIHHCPFLGRSKHSPPLSAQPTPLSVSGKSDPTGQSTTWRSWPHTPN